jgi:hypothetical protein
VTGLVGVHADAAGDAADHAPPADDAGDPLLVDAVLERDDEAAGNEVLADQRGGPDRVVRLGADERDVDRVFGEALDLVEVQRLRMDQVLALGAFELEPVLLDRVDVLGPGIDERDILPRPSKVAADVAADGAGAHERQPLSHS